MKAKIKTITLIIGLTALVAGLPWLFLHPSGPGCNLKNPTNPQPASEPEAVDETGEP